jgi:hypothetical protein
VDKPLSQERLSKDAERLGLYKLLSELETEWARYKKDLFLYSSCVADAIIGHILTLRKQIEVHEAVEQIAKVKEVYPVYPVGVEKNKAS